MKLSEKWLREWVDPPVDTATLVEQLTGAGFEVEGVEPVAGDLRHVVVGEVQEVGPHPDAERLRVCRVAVGKGEPVSVVCGAPNVRPGMRAPVALAGARLADGTEVARSTIRGVESNGMLCSPRELGLGEYADGLMELDADAPAGQALARCLDLDDRSIDISVTPNRGDCLSLSGVAREVGVINRAAVSAPPLEAVPAAVEDRLPVVLEASADCPRYVGRVIRDIDPGARTPLWMQERLRRSGLRSLGPVVDVTNYVMLELGQPMHAFDLEKLERGIRVRRAREGERLVLLDEREIALGPDALVIADETRPVALAGVMGGLESAVTGNTRHLFLESAFFAPVFLAGEARRRGLQTDASYRFERGVSPDLQRIAAERATALLLEIVGGEAGPVVEAVAGEELPVRPPVRLRASRLRLLLGAEVPADTVREVLERLGMDVESEDGAWRVTPPRFRFDISIEADLIEEIARITGYDRVPSCRPRADLGIAVRRPEERISRGRMRAALVERGYQEAITYSFVDPRLQELLDPGAATLRLANPISADMAVMRTSLWPGLVQALLYNLNRQQERIRLFEAGLAYRPPSGGTGGGTEEERRIGGVVAGPAVPAQWGSPRREVDFFDLKSDVEALLDLGGHGAEFGFSAGAVGGLHPGQAAVIEREGRSAGWMGRLHPRIARELKVSTAAFLFELRMAEIEAARLPKYAPISRFPAVRRDIAIVVDESVSAHALRECVGQAGADMLQDLQLFDVYRGEGIDSGKKSLALGLTFQATSRTLNDKEIETLIASILRALSQNFDATLRG